MDSINHLINNGAVTDLLFWVFAALTLVCGLLVIVSRSPVTSAMFLVLTIISLSGLFLLLHAFFLAAVQIIVYAGAVLVLFVFVIMLLDLKEEQRRKIKFYGVVAGVVAVGGILSAFMNSLASVKPPAAAPQLEGDTASLGLMLFTQIHAAV
jgi:NADH-quinone oxidoreductase subunit J